jgi:hypothetical protein
MADGFYFGTLLFFSKKFKSKSNKSQKKNINEMKYREKHGRIVQGIFVIFKKKKKKGKPVGLMIFHTHHTSSSSRTSHTHATRHSRNF